MSSPSSSPSAATAASKKMILLLKSSDGQTLETEEASAFLSAIVRDIIEDNRIVGTTIPIPHITAAILRLVIEFCTKHAADAVGGDSLSHWDAEFVGRADQDTLFDLILAANFLEIQSLLDVTCDKVAEMIKDKTPQEICGVFKVGVDDLV